MTTQPEGEQLDDRTIQATAALALRAGLAMTDVDGGMLPPTFGWMPPPATGSPEVEMGAALAVHALVRVFGLDRQQVDDIAAGFLAEASK